MTGKLLQVLGAILAGVAIVLAIPVFLLVAPFVITYVLCGLIITKFTHICPSVDDGGRMEAVDNGIAAMTQAVADMRTVRTQAVSQFRGITSHRGRIGPS